MTFLLAVSVGLAAPPPCPMPTGEHIVTLGIAAHGHSFGGLAIVEFTGDDWSLTAVSPAGPAIFSVSQQAGQTSVWSAFPEWTPILAKLPFARDLRLLNTSSSASCRAGLADIVVCHGWLFWRGAPGPARMQVAENGARVLTDPWRGYTLTVKESEAGP